jgi:hypothetical protein
MTVPSMLEASAQGDENIKTRTYLEGPKCEIAKTKVTIFGGGKEK